MGIPRPLFDVPDRGAVFGERSGNPLGTQSKTLLFDLASDAGHPNPFHQGHAAGLAGIWGGQSLGSRDDCKNCCDRTTVDVGHPGNSFAFGATPSGLPVSCLGLVGPSQRFHESLPGRGTRGPGLVDPRSCLDPALGGARLAQRAHGPGRSFGWISLDGLESLYCC